jgi:hypothetical protein
MYRLFQLLVASCAIFTQYVQFFLLYLLWDKGLQLDKSSTLAMTNPTKMYISKSDSSTWDLLISQSLALAVVYLLVGIDLNQHLNVMVNLNEYYRLLLRNDLLLMFVMHAGMLVLQVHFGLMLAYYSFYVIF